MPTIKDFAVRYFTNRENTFTSGDYIRGHVVLHLEKQAKISHLYITLKGDTDVRFTTGNTRCFGKEKCFEMRTEFIGDGKA